MKHLITSLVVVCGMLFPACLIAQDSLAVVSDTLIVVENAKNITVAKTADGLKVNISGFGDDGEGVYNYISSTPASDSTSANESGLWNLRTLKAPNKDAKWSCRVMECFYLGGSIDLNGPMDLAYWRSFEVGTLYVVGAKYTPWKRGPQFSIGAGIGYKRFSTHKDTDRIFFRGADGRIDVKPSPQNTTDQTSSVDIMHLDIPFMITQPIYKDWGFSVGAVASFNTYLIGSTKYKVLGENEFGLRPGTKVEETYKHLNQRPVTVDFIASVGYIGGVSFYAKYSPMSVFKDGMGPKFKTLSLGFIIDF